MKTKSNFRAILLGVTLAVASIPASVRAGIPEPDLVWYGKVLTVSGGNTVRVTTGTLTWQIEPLAGGTPWIVSTRLTNINDQFSFLLRVPCESQEPGVAASTNTVVLATPASNYRRLTVLLDGQPLSITVAPSTFSPALADRGRLERIDLTLGSIPPDSDGDGMSDVWEFIYFGAAGANPNDDADGDGMNNLREFRAGTNPTSALSVFEIEAIAPVTGGMRIRWTSVTNKTYRVLRSPTLLVSPASYSVLQSNIVATPPLNELTDNTVSANSQFFYLIEVQP